MTTVSAHEAVDDLHARNDAGLFQLDFRDERFPPFGGAGR
jgi:hypothetical protein